MVGKVKGGEGAGVAGVLSHSCQPACPGEWWGGDGRGQVLVGQGGAVGWGVARVVVCAVGVWCGGACGGRRR